MAFAVKPTPYVLPEEHRGMIPSVIAEARRTAAAAGGGTAGAAVGATGRPPPGPTAAATAAGATTAQVPSPSPRDEVAGEKRKRDKKEKKEKKETKERREKRRRCDFAEPSPSGASGGPTDSGNTRVTSG